MQGINSKARNQGGPRFSHVIYLMNMEKFPSPRNDRSYNPLDNTKVSASLDQKLHKKLVQQALREGRRSRDEFIRTPELKNICGEIISFVHELAHTYGSKRNKVPLKYIHFVDNFSGESDSDEKTSFLSGRTIANGIEIKIEPGKAIALKHVHVLIHELIHTYSFNQASVIAGGDHLEVKTYPSRSGLAVTIPDIESNREYFRGLNEAITETLALTVFEKVLDSSNISQNLKDIFNTLKHETFDTDGIVIGLRDNEEGESYIESNGYIYHRMVFNAMIQEIARTNSSQYKSYSEVEKVFFEAYFTGNFDVVAKIIEKTFGKSTFKRLAQADEFSPEIFAESVGMKIESSN